MHRAILLLITALACTGCGKRVLGSVPRSYTAERPPLTVDLAQDTTVMTIGINTGHYTLRVVNRLPEARYTVRAMTRNVPIPPVELAAKQPSAIEGLAATCPNVRAANEALKSSITEEAVRDAVAALRRAMATDTAGNCLSAAQASIELTQEYIEISPIDSGQELTVTIQRVQSDGASPVWTRIFSTGPIGTWRTSYGFSFIGRAINHSRYYAADSSGTFVVREMHRRDYIDFVPSLLFSWMPTERENRRWSHGWTAGVGFDLSDVVVLGGYQATYHQNLGFTAGIAFNQQHRLMGQYREGDVIGTSLTESQLHERRFVPNPFIALSIRSLTNPFGAR